MRMKMFAGVVAAAMASLALGVSGAVAAPFSFGQGLQLTEAGAPTPPGSTVFNEELVVGQCFIESTGKLVNNGSSIDLINVGSPTHYYCENGASAVGGIRSVALAENGVGVMLSTLTLKTGTGCVYTVPLMQGSFQVPGDAYVTGNATGFGLNSPRSGCAPTLSISFGLAELSSVTDGALETQLVSLGGPFLRH